MDETIKETAIDAQVAALSVGETWCRMVRLDGDQATKDALSAAVDRMRNTARSPISRAKLRAQDGRDYVMETINTRTRSMDVLVGVAVTRVQ